MRPSTRRLGAASILALTGLIAGCDALPKDPEGTLSRARGGVLRVGVSEAAPWVVDSAGAPAEPAGIEPDAIRAFARSLDAEIQWHRGGADEVLRLLEHRELDIVAAGLTRASPWNGRVALTRPYARAGGDERVLATAPGENALLVALERHLRSNPPALDRGPP